MDHYTVNFKEESKALRTIDFIQGERAEIDEGRNALFTDQLTELIPLLLLSTDDEDEDDEDEDGEAGTEEGEGAQTTSGGDAVTAASSSPSAAISAAST